MTSVITVLIARRSPDLPHRFAACRRGRSGHPPGRRGGGRPRRAGGDETHRPDIAVLDIDMPGRDGLDVARAVRDRRASTRLIVLSCTATRRPQCGARRRRPRVCAERERSREIAGAIRACTPATST